MFYEMQASLLPFGFSLCFFKLHFVYQHFEHENTRPDSFLYFSN